MEGSVIIYVLCLVSAMITSGLGIHCQGAGEVEVAFIKLRSGSQHATHFHVPNRYKKIIIANEIFL